MEGKYTKVSALAGILALGITIWQVAPSSKTNHSGEWKMISKIETTEFKNFIGIEIEWVLHLSHSGNQISGTGEKISVNSERLNFRDRTMLTLSGTIDEDQFVLNYIEKGPRRETRGTLTGQFNNELFSGIISSTAANSKGKISGSKVK